MISKECKFSDFVGAVRNKNYFEILHLADQEATAAERLFLRPKVDKAARQRCAHRLHALRSQAARQERRRCGDLRRLQPGTAPATGIVTIPGGNQLLTRS
jgi:hypothetical protein